MVGAGPAGSLTASKLAADGHEVTLLEEHERIGEPMHCAGVVSDSFLRSIPVTPEVLSCIRHAKVVFPGGRMLELERSTPFGYMIDRRDLDVKLADYAVRNGVDLRMGTCFTAANHARDSITAITNKGEIDGDLLVGADGQNSVVAASIGAGYSREYVLGAQADVPMEADNDDSMLLRIGNKVAPGFFSWKIPKDDGYVRYGLCITPGHGNASNYLKSLLKMDGIDIESDRIIKYGGKIPLGYRNTTVGDRTLLIGDAASHVKPVSAGGLAMISAVAPLLCDTVREAYENHLFTSAVLGQYEVAWRREIGASLDNGMRMRRVFCTLSDAHMDRVGEIFDTPEINEMLGSIDIDNPAGIVSPILAQKGVKTKLLGVFLRAKLCRK